MLNYLFSITYGYIVDLLSKMEEKYMRTFPRENDYIT